jgi:hypothetical protein
VHEHTPGRLTKNCVAGGRCQLRSSDAGPIYNGALLRACELTTSVRPAAEHYFAASCEKTDACSKAVE